MDKKKMNELRSQHPDCLLLLPNPTGYVLVGDDALAAAPLLGVKLKKRARGGAKIEVLYENLDETLQTLLVGGQRVAICDAVGKSDELVPVVVTPDEWERREAPALRLVSPPVELRVVHPPEETPEGDRPATEEDEGEGSFPEPSTNGETAETEGETGAKQPEEAAPVAVVVSAAAPPKGPDLQGRLLLPCKLKALADIAADDSTRYAMHGIRLLRMADGWQAQVTDGRVAVWVEGANGNPEDRLARQTFETALRHHTDTPEVILPAPAWERGLGQGKKEMWAGISMGTLETVIAVEGNLLRTEQLDGRFPDIQAVANGCKKPPLVSVNVNPEYLMRLCKVWMALGVERMTLLIYRPDAPIGLVGRPAEGSPMRLSGLLMPLT